MKREKVFPPFKLPSLYVGDKEMFVHFLWYNLKTGKYEREKVFPNIWKGTKTEKLTALVEIKKELSAELKQRNERHEYWTPGEQQKAVKQAAPTTVLQLLQEAEKDTSLPIERRKSFSKLEYHFGAFELAHPALAGSVFRDWNEEKLNLPERFIDFLKTRQLSSKTHNGLCWTLDAIGDYAKQKKQVEGWPEFSRFRVKLIKNETGKYVPLTHEEKLRTFNFYKDFRPNYYLFLLHVYYTCIRPAELHRLQIKDFDLRGKKISVDWMDAKNGLSKHVQILGPLLEVLKAYAIKKYPPNWHLFSENCEPGPAPISTDSFSTKMWWRHSEKVKIPKGKTPYSLKHTFNIDYVENNKANLDWEWLRRHNRHATIAQTQEYISNLTAYFLDEEAANIIDYVKPSPENHE